MRNKMHNRCNALESFPDQAPQVCGNIVFLELVLDVKTLGTAEEEPQEL